MKICNVYPYKPGSRSARELADALGVKRLKHEGSRYKPHRRKVIINWGSTEMRPDLFGSQVLNLPGVVKTACNKLSAILAMDPVVRVPPYTTDPQRALQWLSEGDSVICRTKLNAHSGDGIVLATCEDELVDAPLYTKYVKKKEEYRVHIVFGEVIMTQRKARRLDTPDEEVDWQIRNYQNGFIFEHRDIEVPLDVIQQASAAVGALQLQFGAVDVIWNEHAGEATVLEVNCAPGLQGETLNSYTKAFNKYLSQ